MATWKSFSADVMRAVPPTASFAERSRALKAAGKMWRGQQSGSRSMRRNPDYDMEYSRPSYGGGGGMSSYNTPGNRKAALYVAAGIAVYLLAIRPNQASIAAALSPGNK